MARSHTEELDDRAVPAVARSHTEKLDDRVVPAMARSHTEERDDRAIPAVARLHTAASRGKQKQRHHSFRRPADGDDAVQTPQPAPPTVIDLQQFVRAGEAGGLAVLEAFNAELEAQIVQAAAQRERPETWSSWANTAHPELAAARRPVSARSPKHSSGVVALRAAPALESRRAWLTLRRQLRLSDTLSTAQLRLLYGQDDAPSPSAERRKRRSRADELLREVQCKLRGEETAGSRARSAVTLDGGAALLQRVARMAERVHYTSAQEKLGKWLAKIPRPELSTLAPQSPWKIHVAQQERTRAVNRWAGVGSDAGGPASASGTVLMIKDAQPKELSGDAPDSGSKDKGEQASTPDEGTPPPSVKRGRVAAWRASDARKAAAAARSSLAQKAKPRRVASAPPGSPVPKNARRSSARRSSGAKSARAAKSRQQQSEEEQKDRAKRKQLQQLRELESTLAELASEVDDILH